MITPIPTKRIKELLNQCVEHVKLLHITLCEEHSALSRNNLADFELAVENKLQYTAELEKSEQQIISLLNNSGYVWNKNGMREYIASIKNQTDKKRINSQWKTMRDTILQCQLQNQINGRILNIASINIRQALDILIGQESIPKTYSSSGKSTPGDNKNTIAVA